MGVGEFMGGAFSSPTVNLTKIVRPYLLRSAYLLKAYREIQIHWGKSREQDPVQLRSILLLIQTALEGSSSPALRDSGDPKIDDLFKKANEAIKRYFEGHNITLETTPKTSRDFDDATQADVLATQHLRDIKKRVKQRLDIVRRLKNVDFSIILWPERVRTGKNWASHLVPFTIEEDATLAMLLVRVLCALDQLEKKGVDRFNLGQNPQFFRQFPHNVETWEKSAQSNGTMNPTFRMIEPLQADQTVVHFSSKPNFHLIVDRLKGLEPHEVSVFGNDGMKFMLQYKNIWKLDGSESSPSFIVRLFTGALSVEVPDPRRSPSNSTRSAPTAVRTPSNWTGSVGHQTNRSGSASQGTLSTAYSSSGSYFAPHSADSSRTTLPSVSESPRELSMPDTWTQSRSNPHLVARASSAFKANPPPATFQVATPPPTPSVHAPQSPPTNRGAPSPGRSSGHKDQPLEHSPAQAPISPPPTPDAPQPKSQLSASASNTNLDAHQPVTATPQALTKTPTSMTARPKLQPPVSASSSTAQTSPSPLVAVPQPPVKSPDPVPIQSRQPTPASAISTNNSSHTSSLAGSAKPPPKAPAPSKSPAPVPSPPPTVSPPPGPRKPDESREITPSPSTSTATLISKSSSKPHLSKVGTANGRRQLDTVDIDIKEKSGWFGGFKKKLWG